ncbi:MAG: type II toxin-antitoxin system VapC family toxin [Acidobacteriia bacterium]|nr:type II toxin-antitoxin system VapC family toxin [Terriglobia bacterium]
MALNQMTKTVLDANCFIDAINSNAHASVAVQIILSACSSGKLTVMVSRHTLSELSAKPDGAYQLAQTFEILPHWPVGSICEQVAMIKDLAGTWADAHDNERMQKELGQLAKSGNDIRDRGALLDAIRAKVDVFVTSDRQLAGSGPAKRIQTSFGIRILSPGELANEISQTLSTP